MKCCLNRPLFLTQMAIFPYLLPFPTTAICSCWLFPTGLCEIPSPALQDLFWVEEKGQFVCLRPRGKALHPSKQTKWVFILAKEGARKYLLDDLKAMYPGHLGLTRVHTWSGQLSRVACTAGLKESPRGLQQHTCVVPGVVWSIWCGVSHDAFVPKVSFPSQDQASCN